MPLKKRTEKPSFPCNCGHAETKHYQTGAPIWEDFCAGKPYCDCTTYHPNNLKYLERKYKKSKKKGKQS